MYLSRLVMNLAASTARRDLANAYELHRTLYRCTAGNGDSRLLWRIEPNIQSLPVILVQTTEEPDWSPLTMMSPSYLAEPPGSKPYAPVVERQTVLRFRLRGNPTVRQAGKRRAISTAKGQLQWLQRKAEQGGFRILAVSLHDEQLLTARKAEHTIQVAAVTFDGQLVVTDPMRFLRTLEEGIGPAKAFGFGLLSIAPPGTP